jgi:hypothetical protein
MSQTSLIFICILVQFFAPLLLNKFEGAKIIFNSLLLILLLASLFNLMAGIDMAFNWNPFSEVDSSLIAKGSSSHGGKGSFVVFAIQFWPYVLMGLSLFYIINSLRILKHR